MANSLRSKIKKLYHDNNISEKMCNELLEKLEGHDRELRAKTLKEMGNVLPIATIKFSKEDMQKIVDEKVAQIELDIQEIKNQTIDEFVANAEKWNNNIKSIRNEEAFFTIENIRKIAEQMKGGAE